METQMACRAALNVRGSCAPTTNTHQTDPEQPYTNSCEGSSLDSELIPLESGETCVAAIMTAQSENSKLIITAQKIDSEISIVREWLLTGKFPACIQDFAPASYELKAYWIGRKSLFRKHFVAKSFSNRVARTTSGTDVPARHNLQ